MAVEGRGGAAQVREDEAAIAADLAGSVETERGLRPVKAAGMGYALQLAAEREGPTVIGALKGAVVAAGLPTESGAAMRTAVGEHVDLPVAVADQDHRLAAEPARHPIAGLGDLRFVADEGPAAREDARHLVVEGLRIHVETPVDA